MPLHVQEPQRLFLWLRQVPPALQTLWRWRRWQTAQPSWPGAPAETTAAPSPITSSRPGLPSLWAGRGLTQVGSGRKMIFHLIPDVMVFRWIPAGKFSYSREVRVWGQLQNGGSANGRDSGSDSGEREVTAAAFTWSHFNHFADLYTCLSPQARQCFSSA